MEMTYTEILTMVANEHSYETWEELMLDSKPHWQVHCTKEAMERYAQQKLNIANVSGSVCPRCQSNRIAESDENKDWMDCEWCSLRWAK